MKLIRRKPEAWRRKWGFVSSTYVFTKDFDVELLRLDREDLAADRRGEPSVAPPSAQPTEQGKRQLPAPGPRRAQTHARLAQFAAFLIPKDRREDALGDILETAEEVRATLGPRAARFFFWKEWAAVMFTAHAQSTLQLLSLLIPGRRRIGK
jgi:hypothetical protein